MRQCIFTLLLLGILHISAPLSAQTIRDYYSEPGINPFKDTLGQHFNEDINPFSGGLALSYTDIYIPGNGGFDIKVNRIYNSVQDRLEAPNAIGLGWTMHMGRIVVSDEHAAKLCDQANYATSGIDNPSLELPDGGREVLFLSSYPGVYLITKSRWKAECNGANGMIVTSPDGTVYTMSQYGHKGYLNGETYWYATRIVDRNGNSLDITYQTADGDAYLSTVTASDGRAVTFSYAAIGDVDRLSSVSGAGQTWTYHHQSISGLPGYLHLTQVTRPDGSTWGYEYYPAQTGGGAGSHAMQRVTYPYGASITYQYDYVQFDPTGGSNPTTVISRKDVSAGTASGAWTFTYRPGVTFGSALDETEINAPNGRYRYLHWGYSGTGSGDLWRVGLLEAKYIYSNDGVLIEQEVNNWDGQVISVENYWHGGTRVDAVTHAPIQTQRRLFRDLSVNEIQYSNHDSYGNPQTKLEIGNMYEIDGVTIARRTTTSTYYNDPAKWILGFSDDDTIVDVGTITRSRDTNGNLRSENRFGVETTYTYTGAGDVNTKTDARNKTITYAQYRRSIPQLETYLYGASSIVMSRTVNDSGTVASETNGRGFTKSYGYDSMHRLSSIDFPLAGSSDVSVVRAGNTITLTRGSYERVDELDSFGRIERTSHRDTGRNASIVTNYTYDIFGNKTFESYPNSAAGTTYEYDVLNRVTRVEHPDGSFRTHQYRDTDVRKEILTDEEGYITKIGRAAYGDPSESYVTDIENIFAEGSIFTYSFINNLGQRVLAWQKAMDGTLSGYRQYSYNVNKFLESRTDSEIGTTVFGRDEVGNMISKTVESEPITSYIYDDLGRLETINYPTGTADVTYTYDENNNIKTVSNGTSLRSYDYDDHDNLTDESLTVGSQTYAVRYTINDLDGVDAIRYPTGRTVEYSPDAFGRATWALPYVSSVDYHPNGMMSQIRYANGQITDIELDDRMFIGRSHTHTAMSILDDRYQYDGVGNLLQRTDALNTLNNLVLEYDPLSRLRTVSGPWGAGVIAYDDFGNITHKAVGDLVLDYIYVNQRLAAVFRNGASTGDLQHDAYGNIASWGDPFDPFIPDYAYNYNTAGEMYAAYVNGNAHQYVYDGDHQMVTSTVASEQTHHMYARSGNLLGDYQPDGSWKSEYFYLGSNLIAQLDSTPPVATATAGGGYYEGQTVTLDGAASHAYESTIASYSWTQLSGPPVVLSNANTATATFTPPDVSGTASFSFRLTVVDTLVLSASSDISIAVWDSVPPPGVSSISTQQGVGENRLTWSPVQQAISYTIYWGTAPDVTPGTGNAITGITGTSYLHTNLTNGQNYYYLIVGNNQYGEGTDYTIVSATPGINGWAAPYRLEQVPPPVDQNKAMNIIRILDHPSGKRLVIWAQDMAPTGHTQRDIYASWHEAATGWSTPVTINNGIDAPLGPGGLVTDVHAGTGRVIVAWQSSNNIHAVKYDPVSGWGVPFSTQRPVSALQDPAQLKLAISDTGHVYLAWVQANSNGNYRLHAMTSHIDWQEWSLPGDLGSNGLLALASDVYGNAFLLTSDGQYAFGVTKYDVQAAQWGADPNANAPYAWTNIRVDTNRSGDVLVAGTPSGQGQSPTAIYIKRYQPDAGWSTTESMPSIGASGGFWYALKGAVLLNNGDVILTLSMYDQATAETTYHSAHYSQVSGWEVTSLDPGCCSFITDGDDNSVMAAWEAKTPSGADIYIRRYRAATGWQGPYKVASVESVNEQYQIAIDPAGGATLLMTSSDTESGGLYAAHYVNLGDAYPLPDANPTCAVMPAFNGVANGQGVEEGQTVTATASAQDSDGTIVSYLWEPIEGPNAVYSGGATDTLTLTIPQISATQENIAFKLTVSDDAGNTCVSGYSARINKQSAPGGINITSGNNTNTLTWSSLSTDVSYTLYWDTVPGVSAETSNRIEGLSQPQYSHTNLVGGTTYYYAVSATNQYGVESPFSSEVSARAVGDIWQEPQSINAYSSIWAEPQLSMTRNGNGYAVWIGSDETSNADVIWGNRYLAGSGWQTPEHINVLPPEVDGIYARHPEVAMNERGDVVVAWEQEDPTVNWYLSDYRYSLWARVFIAGQGWQPAQQLETSAYPALHVQAAISPNGDAMTAWAQMNAAANMNITARHYSPNSGWATEEVIDYDPAGTHWSEYPQIAVDGLGNYHVAWTRRDYAVRGYIWSTRYVPGSGWQVPQQVNVPSVIQGEYPGALSVKIAADGQGNAVAAWREWDGTRFNIVAARFAPGTAWSTPFLLETSDDWTYDEQETPRPIDIDMNPAGLSIVSWRQNSRVTISIYDPVTGTWTGAQHVSDTTEGVVIEHPRVAVADNGHAIVAWIGAISATDSTSRVFANDYVPGRGWGFQRMVSTLSVSEGLDTDMDQSGNALVIWSGTYSSQENLWSSYLDASLVAPADSVPSANAGVDQMVSEGAVATLDGSASTDAEGPLTFSWLQTSGPAVALNNPTTATPSFTAPNVTVDTPLSFELTVTDSGGLTATDSVIVTVQMLDADTDGMSDAWEQQHFGNTSALPGGDADGDGISNLDEFKQQTNPLDGDINADAELNVADLMLAQRHVLGIALLNPDQQARLDLAPAPQGGNGVINAGDLVVLQRRVLAAH